VTKEDCRVGVLRRRRANRTDIVRGSAPPTGRRAFCCTGRVRSVETLERNALPTNLQIEVGQRYRIVALGGVASGLWEMTRVYMP
jgi:hypothetical protein